MSTPLLPADGAGGSTADLRTRVLELADRLGVKFLRLQFTDIFGLNKNVEVPDRRFAEALDGRVTFDGSAIEGIVRVEESDMRLSPDLATFRVFPSTHQSGEKVARVICDIHNPDGTPFDGCPRHALKRAIAYAESRGFSLRVGPELEFFLFRAMEGRPTTETDDGGGYFDLVPVDQGEEVRRQIVLALESMGVQVEAAHHEVAAGQHEIDFLPDHLLAIADHVTTGRLLVKHIAAQSGLHATFMPKPLFAVSGSGMHIHQTLFTGDGNAFFDPEGPWQLSDTCLRYIGGLLRHAKGLCAVTNPLVNSYKRLVPGFEAPTSIAWSERNRSPLVRVPSGRGTDTRVELRMPDPSCNPYLAFAVMLRAGLDGVEQGIDPGPPVNKDIYALSRRERRQLKIDDLPGTLADALDALERNDVLRDALGEHIFHHFLEAKREEWDQYLRRVSAWEIERYLTTY